MSEELVPGVVGIKRVSWRSSAWIAGCTTAANVLGYGFNVVMSHALDPADFGELGSLLAVALIIAVPGTAMQAVVARRIASSGAGAASEPRPSLPTVPTRARTVLRDSTTTGLALALLVLICAPALHGFLGVSSWWTLLWLALTAVPTTISFGLLGLFQGTGRFVALGVVLVTVQLARIASALVCLLAGLGVSAVFLGTFVFTVLVVALALPATGAGWPRPAWSVGLIGELARDSAAVLGVLVLSNLDLLLARHYLSRDDSGVYAAANLITKAGFWAPAFIATIAYPALARSAERRATLRRSALLLAALGTVVVVLSALCAPLVPVILGRAYEPAADLAWIFALQGVCLAAVLLGVYAGLAVRDRRLAWCTWGGVLTQAAVIATVAHHDPKQIITVMSIGSVTLVLIALALEWPWLRAADPLIRQRSARRPLADPGGP